MRRRILPLRPPAPAELPAAPAPRPEARPSRTKREPRAIVRDAIAGTLLFVDPDGTVTGDVEEELGRKLR